MHKILILFLLCNFTWANEASRVPSQAEKTIIISTDNELAEEFFGEYQLKRKEEKKQDSDSGLNALPTPAELEAIYAKVGIKEYLSDMDQMDKDIFILKVKKYSLDRVIKKYPNIPEKKIKELKELLK